MKRLTKMQVKALASRIIEEIKQPIRDHNNKIKESKAYIQFSERKDMQKIVNLSMKYKMEGDNGKIWRYIEELRSTYFADKLIKIPYLSFFEIENDIIVSTIECDNLDSLIESIKQKYS
jgi:hypothetical protein